MQEATPTDIKDATPIYIKKAMPICIRPDKPVSAHEVMRQFTGFLRGTSGEVLVSVWMDVEVWRRRRGRDGGWREGEGEGEGGWCGGLEECEVMERCRALMAEVSVCVCVR